MKETHQGVPILVHGGDWAGYQAEYHKSPLDFSANVSPLGVPQGIQNAIQSAAAVADRYPDPLCRSLRRKIAMHEGVSEKWILCGNGAADLIFRAVLAKKPERALLTAPTFGEYEAALTAWGCQVQRYYLQQEQDFRIGEDFLETIIPGIDMVFLCEPNNPTGLTSPRSFLMRVADRCCQCGALLIVDECFGDFLDLPEEHTLKEWLVEYPNMMLLKAFTKLYGMAGVRLGYTLCADSGFLQQLAQVGQPWAVSSLAQAAGEAALEETEYVAGLRSLIQTERPFLQQQLKALGLRVLPGEANYLLFFCPVPLIEPLRRKGILLRSCANYAGLHEGWYRTAIRTHEENLQLIQALREVLS